MLTNEPHATTEAHADVICDNAATKCAETDPNQLASQQNHLTTECKAALLKNLEQHE